MTESEEMSEQVFWLFHDQDESEVIELRKLIDPEIDTKPLEGIHELLYKLRHLLE
jgi:hypothetical protein